jgi:poly-gamma-glutamate synthesis protein (capsule biosynthesis protein)
MRTTTRSVVLLVCLALVSGCGPLWGDLVPTVPTVDVSQMVQTLIPPTGTPPVVITPLPSSTPVFNTPTVTVPPADSLWISPSVPRYLRAPLEVSGMPLTGEPSAASVRLGPVGFDQPYISESIYALVAPFPELTDGVTLAELQSAWTGQAAGGIAGHVLWMEESTREAMTLLWGPPSQAAVYTAPADQLLMNAWVQPYGWALVPFDQLEPRWKVLAIDGQNPLWNSFDPAAYPLKLHFQLEPIPYPLAATNRNASRLTVLAMTGVTALVRGTADRMERKGLLYPGEEVRSVLLAADIAHISNEIPFLDGCPTPDPYSQSLTFCSDPRYIALLEDVGTDVVELTGNHMRDHGSAPFLTTLDMYNQRGWAYFGGGADLADSQKSIQITHNGNQLAFIGCNRAGPDFAWATVDRPGSAPCDFAFLQTEISRLRALGMLPVVTFQYNEYYVPNPTPYEQDDFRLMAEAGAVIVSGSQSHVPAAMEFYGPSLLHYGLGNLFFDQMAYPLPNGEMTDATRNLFIDRHVIYDGRYISTELLTFRLEDYSRPRPMTATERRSFLQFIFDAAGW